MINDNYIELMVPKKTSTIMVTGAWLLLVMAILSFLGFLLTLNYILIFVAIGAGIGFYFLRLHSVVEFEYLYVDKELTIDRILSRSKRKTIKKIDMDRVEMIAPVGSYHLDTFKNRTGKDENYTSGMEDKKVYTLIADSGKILIEVNDDLIKLMRNTMPRKVFTE